MLYHAPVRNLKFISAITFIKCPLETCNNATLEIDPQLPSRIERRGASVFPEGHGLATRSAEPSQHRDESNSSTHVVFLHPRNRGRNRWRSKRRTHSEK